MPTLRAQVRLPYVSGVPQDISTNTFHFFTTTDPPTSVEFEEIRDRIIAAYGFVGEWISSIVSRSGCSVRLYNLDDPEPRVPVYEDDITLPAASHAESMPSEVALVLSYRGPYSSGQSNAQRRNRCYIGPLIENAGFSSSGVASRPSSPFTNDMLSFAAALADDLGSTTVRWNVYSPTSLTTFGVIEAWVNNEFDTQRRRGVEATSRDSIPITQ